MTFEQRKLQYAGHLAEIENFPVWTFEQMKQFLHLDFDTVQKFVAAKWLYKFNVGRCTFYSCNNKKFTNQAIIKSIMMIDAHYYVDYSQYDEWLRYGSTLENKSLLARGVRHIGYMDNSYHTNIYQVFVPQRLTPKEYPKLAKLLIDIHNESDSDRIHVFIITRDGDLQEFKDYLEEYPQLVISDAIQPSHFLSSPSPPAFNLPQHQGLFQ